MLLLGIRGYVASKLILHLGEKSGERFWGLTSLPFPSCELPNSNGDGTARERFFSGTQLVSQSEGCEPYQLVSAVLESGSRGTSKFNFVFRRKPEGERSTPD